MSFYNSVVWLLALRFLGKEESVVVPTLLSDRNLFKQCLKFFQELWHSFLMKNTVH